MFLEFFKIEYPTDCMRYLVTWADLYVTEGINAIYEIEFFKLLEKLLLYFFEIKINLQFTRRIPL